MEVEDHDNWPAAGLDAPDGPEADSILVVRDGSAVRAHCGLWWRDPPVHQGQRCGLIGQYRAEDAAASRQLLKAACERLAAAGLATAVGPMDASTWFGHRLVVDSDGSPPFPLEPTQPAAWVDWWRDAGFAPWLGYHSAVTRPIDAADPRLAALHERLARRGLRTRPIDENDFDAELAAIHDLSLTAFAGNAFYRPLPLDTFLTLYRPLKGRFDAAASRVAEDADGLAGFLFAYPAPPVDGASGPTLVIKTLAVRPGRSYAGLGVLLADHAHRQAAERGYQRVIHALMQDDNVSARIRASGARVFRRYALFARHLDGMGAG